MATDLRIGEWLFQPDLHQLIGPGGAVHLEPRTTTVLGELAKRGGQVSTRDDLLDAVWGETYVGEASLTHCIWELRKAFDDDARNPRFIQTVPRRGYRLLAEVSEVEPTGPAIKTLLISDLVDSTRLVEKLGDANASELFDQLDFHTRDLLAEHGGREIDKSDGFLLLFERPIHAVRFALAYHDLLDRTGAAHRAALAARIGIHLGEVVLRENRARDVARGAKPLEVEGLAKPLTARLMAVAAARQTLLTRGAFDLARRAAESSPEDKERLRWLAHGGYLFRGIDEALEVFEVGLEGAAPLEAPGDSAKARRVLGDGTILGWRPGQGLEVPQRPNWVLQQKLGEGGFGEVWLAAHGKTRDRRVFKFCYRLDRLRALQREVAFFRLMKETLGDRDDITRILDWNFDEAPYFLETEYTQSGSLPEWAEAQGGPAEVDMGTRIEIVAQVAEALAAAHSVGMLHKDVKPANILIHDDREGRPYARLTDFGIGHLFDERRLVEADITLPGETETGLMQSLARPSTSGTVLYQAPELIEGKTPTTQADIYALGVILYQFVVGDFRRPLAPGWRRDVADEILVEDIALFVDGSPRHRPGNALEVADRLRRLEQRRAGRRADELARQEAEANRLELVENRRRRRILVGVVGGLGAVLGLVSLLAVLAFDARREAVQRRNQAEELIGFMLGDLRGKLEPLGRSEILIEVGDRALAYFEAVPEEDLSGEELFRRVQAISQIGQVRRSEGKAEEALDAFRRALALAEDLVARDDDNLEWRAALGEGHFWPGYVLFERGELEDALVELRAYLAVAEDLVRRQPDNGRWQLEVSYAQSSIGSVLEEKGDLQGALAAYRVNLEVTERLAAAEPDNHTLQLELAQQHNQVGEVFWKSGDLDAASRHFQADQAIVRRLLAEDPENAAWLEQLAINQAFLGILWEQRGELAVAMRYFQAQQETAQKLVTIDAENVFWQNSLVSSEVHLGRSRLAAGEEPRVILPALHGCRARLGALLAKDPRQVLLRRNLATTHLALGRALIADKDSLGALDEIRDALQILTDEAKGESAIAHTEWMLAEAYLLQGLARSAGGSPTDARAAWRRAVAAVETIAEDSNDPRVLAPWAEALARLDRIEEARPIFERLYGGGYREKDFVRLGRERGLLPDS